MEPVLETAQGLAVDRAAALDSAMVRVTVED
jgi:hypothetical protein